MCYHAHDMIPCAFHSYMNLKVPVMSSEQFICRVALWVYNGHEWSGCRTPRNFFIPILCTGGIYGAGEGSVVVHWGYQM